MPHVTMHGAGPINMAPLKSLLAIIAAFGALLAQLAHAGGDGWQRGRATAYDGPNDFWSIHEGEQYSLNCVFIDLIVLPRCCIHPVGMGPYAFGSAENKHA